MIRVAVPCYNAAPWIRDCVESIRSQTVKAWTCCVVNDASTDKTRPILDCFDDPRITVLHRPVNVGAVPNLLLAFTAQTPNDDDICITVDGDDRLATPTAFARVLTEYQSGAQLTYGNFCRKNQERSWVKAYPEEIRQSRRYRHHEWLATHLRTFRYRLWRHLTPRELHDPDTGQPWPCSWDLALMLPMLEMCRADQVRFIPEEIYYYNDTENPLSDHARYGPAQAQMAERIRLTTPMREMLAW